MTRCLRVAYVCALLVVGAPASGQTAADLFSDAVLHRIDLWVHTRDWENLRINFRDNTFYPAELKWNGLEVTNIGIRSRGGGSRSPGKPGLHIDFGRYASNQRFLGLKSLVLDNLTQDPSGLSEALSMKLHARLGQPAPRESFARVYVNGWYVGLYAVVEPIDKVMLARVYGSDGDDVQDDGYLYEYHYNDAWHFEGLGDGLDGYMARFEPRTHESQSAVEKWGDVRELIDRINHSPLEDVSDLCDLPAFVRYVAAQNFLAEDDGILGYQGVNNFYLYRREGTRVHVLFPWDADRAFAGREWDLEQRHDENVLMSRLMREAWARDLYFDTLIDAVRHAPWLAAEADRLYELIDGSMREDPGKGFSNERYEEAREHVRTFVLSRAGYVYCHVPLRAGRPLPVECR